MNVFVIVAAVGYALLLVLFFRAVGRRLPGAQPPPKRTAADVMADLAQARRARDLTTCQLIWPNPPSARVIEAQYRHDTAKQRKEEDQ